MDPAALAEATVAMVARARLAVPPEGAPVARMAEREAAVRVATKGAVTEGAVVAAARALERAGWEVAVVRALVQAGLAVEAAKVPQPPGKSEARSLF